MTATRDDNELDRRKLPTVLLAAQWEQREPGTQQLTINTFTHDGGARTARNVTSRLPRIQKLFKARWNPKSKISIIVNQEGLLILLITLEE